MGIVNKLEPRLGKFAMPGIIKIIAGFQLLVAFLGIIQPHLVDLLVFDRGAILEGQVWRVFSFIFLPNLTGNALIFAIIIFLFMSMVSEGLEHAWGAFRVTVFIVTGHILIVILSFIPWGGGFVGIPTGFYLLESAIVAFGIMYPNHEIRLWFVLPLKMKYLAMLIVAHACFAFLQVPPFRPVIAASFFNLAIWITPTFYKYMKHRTEVTLRRREYDSKQLPADEAFHRCGVCDKTEQDDPHLEFRVASDGEEYCEKCLPTVKAKLERPAETSG